MTGIWNTLYEKAMETIKPMKVSETMTMGEVAAAILTKSGNIYTGICIDTSSSLGMCAERNALSTMLTHGEYEVDKVAAVYQDGTVWPPCGACREFMIQLGDNAGNIEILLDNTGRSCKLIELMPEHPF